MTTHPTSPIGAKVAKCYVCLDIVDKVHMKMVGFDKEDPERGYYRCVDCYAGGEKWMKHFMHRSSLRSLFMGLEGRKMDAEIMKSVGRRIVEKTKEKHERAIADRLDAKRGTVADVKTANPAVFKKGTGRDSVPKKRLRADVQQPASTRVVAKKKGGLRRGRGLTIRRGR